ncbi:MAG: phage holin family protein [Candidatus Sumerlaeaceae bacterium]
MAIRETGIYPESDTRIRTHDGPELRTEAESNGLADMIRRLTADLGTMISLKIELLKAEMRESVSGYAKDGVMVAIAAVMGVFAALFINVVLMCLFARLFPFSEPINYALGALGVTLLHGIGAGVLFMIARKRMSKRTLMPERSMQEMKRDKQWITDTIA